MGQQPLQLQPQIVVNVQANPVMIANQKSPLPSVGVQNPAQHPAQRPAQKPPQNLCCVCVVILLAEANQ